MPKFQSFPPMARFADRLPVSVRTFVVPFQP